MYPTTHRPHQPPHSPAAFTDDGPLVLPFTTIEKASPPITRCALSVVNDRGRIACRAILERMGWTVGHPITYTLVDHVVAVRSSFAAPRRYRIDRHGHLRLPAQLRHATGITAGDSVLLLPLTRHNTLAILPPPTLQQALSAVLASLQASL